MYSLRVDGGAVTNSFPMLLQSDILRIRVKRPQILELTALDSAFLAGLAVGFWSDLDEVRSKAAIERKFRLNIETVEPNARYKSWQKAVTRVRFWEDHE